MSNGPGKPIDPVVHHWTEEGALLPEGIDEWLDEFAVKLPAPSQYQINEERRKLKQKEKQRNIAESKKFFTKRLQRNLGKKEKH